MVRTLLIALTLALTTGAATAQLPTLVAPFDADYSVVDLGAVPGLPAPAGGLTFEAGDSDTILIGGAANSFSADIYSIGVARDMGHVSGFVGMATSIADANGIGSGGIDGGLSYGPGGVLFYTSYSDNSLGQIKPGSTGPDRQTALSALGVATSVGALAFVPPGFSGAGRMKLAQYNAPGNWYDVTLGAPDAGTYPVTAATLKATIGGGPEGIIYVKAGNPQFAADSILVSEYSTGKVAAYEVDAEGDPVVATRRDFITGLTGAEGAAIDAVTGDFLFSTFGGGNRVIVVRGFIPPPTTTTITIATTTSSSTSTSTSTSTTSTSTAPPATTSSSTSTSTTSTSTSSTTTTSTTAAPTTTTVPDGDCALVPPGPTFASIECRLAALVDETEAEAALGPLQAKVLIPLGKAVERVGVARTQCAAGESKVPRARLKQTTRQLIQYSHRLRGRAAKKKVPLEILDRLSAAADAIQTDVRTLRAALACPADAG